jgi:hypothetical protein
LIPPALHSRVLKQRPGALALFHFVTDMSTFEHAYYIGNGLSLIIYGLDIAMYYSTMCNLRLTHPSWRRSDRGILIFSTASLLLLTIDVSTNAIYGEQAWITFRDSTPGGPPAWIVENFSVWYQVLSTSSVAGLIFMSDGYLVRPVSHPIGYRTLTRSV